MQAEILNILSTKADKETIQEYCQSLLNEISNQTRLVLKLKKDLELECQHSQSLLLENALLRKCTVSNPINVTKESPRMDSKLF